MKFLINSLIVMVCMANANSQSLTSAVMSSAMPSPSPAATTASTPRAKSVILVFLAGGPSQTDTFDPKPMAGRDYYGMYKQPIKTNVNGVEICEKLVNLATIADKYSIIRSMTHNSNAHEIGQYVMYTGDMSGGTVVYPSFGAVISYLKRDTYRGVLPPYISVTSSSTRFNESGFLGPQYKPFDTGGAPESSLFEVEGIINKKVSDELLRNRRELLSGLEQSTKGRIEQNVEVRKLSQFREDNFSLIMGDARKVFDLSSESEQVRGRYGMTRFGQSCLLARRLVEQGTPVVVVTYNGWDTHKEHFKRMDERLADLDRGLSALIDDLDKRGLLDQTIVLCGGEFGRTPKVMWEPPWNGGRGHYGDTFSYLVAGGGFAGGKVIGQTDPKGEKVVKRPVYPCDLIGSVYYLMGYDPSSTISHPQLGKIPLLPSLGKKEDSEGILTELFLTK